MNKEIYPLNLIHDLFGKDYEWEGNNDQLAGLDYAISTLTGKEQGCLYMRYREQQIYKSIAAEYSLTIERIRQIIAKALRKLRSPMRSVFIKNGYLIIQNERKKKENDIFIQGYGKYGVSDAWMASDFSIRTQNCLLRSDLRTLHDIVDKVRDDGLESLLKIRNLGQKSLVEIVNALENYYDKSLNDILSQ